MDEDKTKEGHPSTDPSDPAVGPAAGYVFGISPETASDPATSDATNPGAMTSDSTSAPAPPEPPKESYANLPSTNLPAVVLSKSTEATISKSSPAKNAGAAGGASGGTGSAAAGGAAAGGTAAGGAAAGGTAAGAGVQVAKSDKFAVDEVVTFGWKAMLQYFWPLTGVLTCNCLVASVPVITSLVLTYLVPSSAGTTLLSAVVNLVGGLVGLVMSLGVFNLYLRIVDGDTITVRDVYSKYKRTWNFCLAGFVYGFMVAAGYICLILPGIYLQLRFQFYPYFILDSDASPITSLKASWAITKGATAELFFLWIVNYFIIWVGTLCLLLGIFPAQMVQNIALAKTYRALRKNTPLSEMPPGLMPVALISDTEPPPQLAV
ncbi:MAG: hypothetical protein JST89_20750 [Cyanobacteria bacterium SZAS-4]|nr:hypothetical protein [Cyanobacteria bacterium SZAS-4]